MKIGSYPKPNPPLTCLEIVPSMCEIEEVKPEIVYVEEKAECDEEVEYVEVEEETKSKFDVWFVVRPGCCCLCVSLLGVEYCARTYAYLQQGPSSKCHAFSVSHRMLSRDPAP